MASKSIHTIEGCGVKNPPQEEEKPFNPRLFHRGMIDLQEFVLNLQAIEDPPLSPEERVDQQHEYVNDSKDELVAKADTALDDIITALPSGWDTSVVTDANESYSGFYGVVMRLYCGGGISVWGKVMIREYPAEINIEFTDPTFADSPIDSPHTITMEKLEFDLPATKLAELMRALSNAITAGYTAKISTTVRAIDYRMSCLEPRNDRPGIAEKLWDLGHSDWAGLRGVSADTTNANYRTAMNELSEDGIDVHEDPIRNKFRRGAALKEVDQDTDQDTYVRLV